MKQPDHIEKLRFLPTRVDTSKEISVTALSAAPDPQYLKAVLYQDSVRELAATLATHGKADPIWTNNGYRLQLTLWVFSPADRREFWRQIDKTETHEELLTLIKKWI